MWCVADNHNNTCLICAKKKKKKKKNILNLLDSNFNQAVINKISIFNEIAPRFKNSKFIKYIWNFLDQLLLPYEFHVSWQEHVRNLLLLFLPVVSC